MCLLHLLLQLWWITLAWASLETKPGCQPKCGNVTIPYPFGIGDAACSISERHNISCKTSFNPPRPFIHTDEGDYEILDISPTQMRIKNIFASYCFAEPGATIGPQYSRAIDLSSTPYTFSDTENKFTAIGCNILAQIKGFQGGGDSHVGGCLSLCSEKENVINGSCFGIGCCQTSIPKGMTYFFATLEPYNNITTSTIYPCSYAMLVEQERYTFSESDLLDPSFVNKATYFPLVLDWVVGSEMCKVAQINSSTYACKENSICDNSDKGAGYRCNCSEGYTGNPYLGCQDIDECADKNNDCVKICSNTPGGYNCSCPVGTYGDGTRHGNGCISSPDKKKLQVIIITLGIGLTVGLFLLLASLWLYQVLKKRRNKKIKEYFFKLNGGLLLKQQISSAEGSVEKTNIFNAEELEKATDYYNENRILGQGGQGTVYKGMLTDGKIVAIKKPRTIDEGQVEQFINEVVILSQINHRNVVKLLGCCLETKVPLLVYEYISNGTLFHHIHNQSEEFSMTWDNRLRIATEVAGALAYLHSAASMPIYHRDVKSTNILLDDKFRAKVSDFGTSRSVPVDKTHLTTLVQGTFGYLDPEYFQSSQFTDRSDVYSFGVVLVELLTGERPIISLIGSQERKNLVTHFIQSTEENHLFEILDAQVMEGQKVEIEAVASLAKRCLNFNGKKRPPMKEVTTELEGLRMSSVLFPTKINHNEAEVITDLSRVWETGSTSTLTGYGNLDNSAALRLDAQPLLLNKSTYSV